MKEQSMKVIYNAVRSSIENGLYTYGQPIPSERELSRTYYVSRTTVRKAIDLLVNQGLLCRRQGKGTFVSLPRLNASTSITSTSRYLLEHGIAPSSRVFYTGVRSAGYKYSRIFQISEDAPVYQLYRQRLGNGIPYSVEYAFFPLDCIPDADSYDFSITSLYDAFKAHGIYPAVDHQTLDLIAVSRPQSTLLDVAEGTCAFMRKSTVYSTLNRPMEYTLSYSTAEKYSFELS